MKKKCLLCLLLTTTSLAFAQMPLPYSFDFSNSTAFSSDWTVIDNNADGKTWALNSGTARSAYSSSLAADDWMISPEFNLLAGKIYKLSFKVKTYNTSAAENLKVYLGKGATITDNITELFKLEGYKNSMFVTQSKSVTVEADGLYRFKFYAYSSKNQWYIYVDDVVVEEVVPYPAQINDLKVSPAEQGVLSATLTWTNPSLDQFGNALDALTAVKVYRDGQLLATLDNQLVGSVTSYVDRELVASGKFGYKVVAANVHGDAQGVATTVTSSWIGEDSPAPVTELKASATDGGVSLLFNAPTIGKNGGWINATTLKYKIKRHPDGVMLEEDYAGTVPYLDETIGEVAAYSYEVTAYNGLGSAGAVTSNKVVTGAAKHLPYSTGFDTANEFDVYSIITSNSDKSWKYYVSGSTAVARFESTNKDWLITPALHLEVGKSYKLTFFSRVYSAATNNIKSLKVTLGQGLTADVQTKDLGLFTVDYALFKETSVLFSVGASGSWNIGFNCFSSLSTMYLDLDNISVVEIPSLPDKVSAVSAVAQANGIMACDVSWKNPTLNQVGDALANLDSVVVYRGAEMVCKKVNPPIGAEMSCVDAALTVPGKYEYSVVAYNANGAGERVSALSSWIGADVPSPVTNLALTDESGVAVINFTAPTTGENGGWLNAENLVYKIERNPGKVVLTEGHKATVYRDVEDKPLASYYYVVTAVTDERMSTPVVSNVLMFGDATSLPYEMTFKADEDFGIWTVVDGNADGKTWTLDTKNNQVKYDSYSKPNEYLFTPPFKTGAGLHKLKFSIKTYSGTKAEQVKVVLGSTTNPADQIVLKDYPTLKSGLFLNETVDFEVPTHGKWYVGFHLYSNDPWGTYINNVSIAADESVTVDAKELMRGAEVFYYDARAEMLRVLGDQEVRNVVVCGVSGQVVYATLRFTDAINLAHVPAGVYVVKYETENGIETFKMIK